MLMLNYLSGNNYAIYHLAVAVAVGSVRRYRRGAAAGRRHFAVYHDNMRYVHRPDNGCVACLRDAGRYAYYYKY